MAGQNPLAQAGQNGAQQGSQGQQGIDFNNPLFGIASGLLSAAQPSTQPQSFAGGLSRGLGLASEMQRKQGEQQLKQQQLQQQETPQQKMERQLATESAKQQQQSIQKKKESIEEDLPHLLGQVNDLEDMSKINKSHPFLFGDLKGQVSGWRDYDEVGQFRNLQQKQVARAERELSSRGSNQALKASMKFKPDFADPHKVARGKIKSSKDLLMREINDQLRKYKQLTGKMPDTGYVLVQRPDGGTMVLTEEEYKRRSGQ